jgi:hypothetical protein
MTTKQQRFYFIHPVQAEYAALTRSILTTTEDRHIDARGYVEFRGTETKVRVPLANITCWINEGEEAEDERPSSNAVQLMPVPD